MKKRLLSILLVLVMAFSMLPVTALANNQEPPADPVVYGSYTDGEWVQDPDSNGIYEQDGITVSKTAVPTGKPNEYTITLTVETGTTTTTVASKAATVLIIDVSGSMDFCAECGEENWHKRSCKYHSYNPLWNVVTQDQSRMAAAKAAANNFIGTYAGDTEGSGRYLAIVSFSTSASPVLGWTDVSTPYGKASAESAISRLSANGGTNLDDALRTATGLMGDSLVSSLQNKFTVALTDGAPTFYIKSNGDLGGYGDTGSAETNAATAASAATLRQLCTLYTVCFGASDDLCWDGGRKRPAGPTVGAFLRDSIATPGCAYDADNTTALNEAFASITEDITSSIDISGASVTDPMAPRIDFTLPAGVSGDEDGFTWELSDPTEKPGGGYIYTLTYTITLDTTGDFDEDAYYPTNGDTYLTLADGTVIHFPVPAVKGTAPRYTVTYEPGDHGTFTAQTTGNLRYGDSTPDAPAVTGEAGWTFTGWEPKVADTVTGDATYVAQWEQSSYTVTYDYGTAPAGASALPASATYHYGETVTVADAATAPGYTFNGWYLNGEKVTSFTMPAENVTLTGTWSQNEYTVSYDYGTAPAGASALPATATYHYGDTVTVADAATAPGYTFNGWYLNGEKVTSFTMPAENVTLTGTWSLIPVPGLTVTKTANDEKASVGDTISWNITVKNTGNVDLTGITLTDTLSVYGDVALYRQSDNGWLLIGADYTFDLEEGNTAYFKAEYKVKTADAGKTI